ncbi:hypothetical protein [Caulobacter sp. 17J80-11]|uniref:hypothetical protein n=1 Tax=Caulobacter sp. 17J80-11 TaxID=2763502 RepID=UPI001CA3D1A0|nr:hypothetical protein [Caulobacter sp. 17J80-11]
MATERVTERNDGSTRERVIERNENSGTTVVERGGGGSGLGAVVAIVLGLIVIAVAAYFLSGFYQQETVKTAAVSDAAESVGQAADNVGQAARDAADSIPAPAVPAPSK